MLGAPATASEVPWGNAGRQGCRCLSPCERATVCVVHMRVCGCVYTRGCENIFVLCVRAVRLLAPSPHYTLPRTRPTLPLCRAQPL